MEKVLCQSLGSSFVSKPSSLVASIYWLFLLAQPFLGSVGCNFLKYSISTASFLIKKYVYSVYRTLYLCFKMYYRYLSKILELFFFLKNLQNWVQSMLLVTLVNFMYFSDCDSLYYSCVHCACFISSIIFQDCQFVHLFGLQFSFLYCIFNCVCAIVVCVRYLFYNIFKIWMLVVTCN